MVTIDMDMPSSCDTCGFCEEVDPLYLNSYLRCMNFTTDCFGEEVTDYVAARHPDCNLERTHD